MELRSHGGLQVGQAGGKGIPITDLPSPARWYPQGSHHQAVRRGAQKSGEARRRLRAPRAPTLLRGARSFPTDAEEMRHTQETIFEGEKTHAIFRSMCANRTSVSKFIETQVLVASRRRCCLCVYLHGQNQVRKGQLAHLDRNPNDSCFDNLVFLCHDHHDEYDGRTSQSKGLTEGEVRA